MGSRFTVRRVDEPDGASAACLDDPKVRENFPWVVWGPSPPFALGSVWAVCPSEEYALGIASALERSPEIVERVVAMNRERVRRALSGGLP